MEGYIFIYKQNKPPGARRPEQRAEGGKKTGSIPDFVIAVVDRKNKISGEPTKQVSSIYKYFISITLRWGEQHRGGSVMDKSAANVRNVKP
jgi:hypothetical protein